MSKQKNNTRIDFENILLLIEEARNRAFSKVNAELVMLYYHVGSIVALKVKQGVWGEGTIDQLAEYIQIKQPGLRGFNRRGLYRMKQFYETYSDPQFLLAVPDPLKGVVCQQYFNCDNDVVTIREKFRTKSVCDNSVDTNTMVGSSSYS